MAKSGGNNGMKVSFGKKKRGKPRKSYNKHDRRGYK